MAFYRWRVALVLPATVSLLLLTGCRQQDKALPVAPTSTPAPTPATTPAPAVTTPKPSATPAVAATPSPAPPASAALLEDAAYTNNAVGFSIQSPRGWTKDDSGTANTLVIFRNTQLDTDGGQPFVANINIMTDSMGGKDFDGYLQLTKQLLPQQVPRTQISGDKGVTLGPGRGHLLEWTMPQGRPPLKVLTLLAPSQAPQDAVFVVTFTALESAWSKYQDIAQAALLSFRTATPTPLPPLLEFTGKLPPIVPVTYIVPEGETVTVPALQGWVSLVAAQRVTADRVVWAAASVGGKIVEANVRLGLYTLSVSEGKEGALMARLRQESWVVEASPVFFVGRAQQGDKPVKVVDFPFDPAQSSVGDPCHDSHGDLTALQIIRAGRRAEIIDVRNKSNQPEQGPEFVNFPWYFSTGKRIAEAMETGSVVNASIGARSKLPIKVRDRIGEIQLEYKLVGAEYKHAQAAFLAMVYRTAEEGPDVPVVVSAGNGDALDKGQDLSKYVEALRKQFPNAARRVRIVEAWWTNPKTGAWERAPWSDYSSVGSIAAPGVNVPIETTGARGLPVGSVKCSGTSFAAPVVSGLVDGMRKAAPDKSAGEVWVRFEKVTQRKLGLDWDKAGLPRRLANDITGRGVARVQLEPPVATIQTGKNQLFRAVAKDASGTIISDLPASAFTWSSSSPAIATVNNSGSAAGKATGKAEITVSIEGVTGKASLTVAAARPDLTVTAVSFSPSSGKVGDTLSVTFTIKNQGGAESGPFSNRVSLATTHYGTNYSLGNFSMESLSAGASRTVTVRSSPIHSSVTEGSYWVTVFTDGFQQIAESDENNNIGSSNQFKFKLQVDTVESWTGTLTGSSKLSNFNFNGEMSYQFFLNFTFPKSLVATLQDKSYGSGKGSVSGASTVTSQVLTDYGRRRNPNAKILGRSITDIAVDVSAPNYEREIWAFRPQGQQIILYAWTDGQGNEFSANGYKGFVLLVENVTPTTISGKWRTADVSGYTLGSLSGTFTLTRQ